MNEWMIEMRRMHTLDLIETNETIRQITKIEPAMKAALIVAVTQEVRFDRSHWQMYEALKQIVSQYVGWDAHKPELATSTYYERMIYALESLLPLQPEEWGDENWHRRELAWEDA